jgi:hypothetical protein
MRTLGSINHTGLDEEPIAILLRRTAQCASMGYDPTIGGPAWAAAWAGPFLAEHTDHSRAR